MLGYFPTPYNDEVIFSIFTRYHKESGNSTLSQTLTDLFGNKINNGTVSNFPGRLNYLHSQMDYNETFTPDYLINKHTLFPVYKPFLSYERVDQIINEAKMSNSNKIPQMLGEASGDITRNKYPIFCIECLKEQLKLYGEFYLNRIHQFPGNKVCHIHKVPLQSITSDGNTVKAKLISIDLKNIKSEQKPFIIKLIDYFYILAKDISFFFENDYGPIDLKVIHEKYKEKLNRLGFINSNGDVNQSKLISEFINYYPKDFLDILKCNVNVRNKTNWIRSISKNQMRYIHPLRHILLIKFLFGSIEDFLRFNIKKELTNRIEQFGNGPWPCLNPVADHYKENVIKEYKLSQKSKPHRPIGIFECSCGFIYSKVGPITSDIKRHHVIIEYGQIWKSKLEEYLLDNKYSINQISKIMYCPEPTLLRNIVNLRLDKHLKTNVMEINEIKENIIKKELQKSITEIQYKDDILKYIKENPNTNRSTININIQKQYAWLKIYCKEWLNNNIPLKRIPEKNKRLGKTQINWIQRDKQLSIEVLDAIKKIKAKPKYKRITIGLIHNEMNNFRPDSQLNKLPITKGIIEDNIESLEQSLKRRITYVLEELLLSSIEVTRSKVIVKAHIKKKHLTKELDEYICDLICTVSLNNT